MTMSARLLLAAVALAAFAPSAFARPNESGLTPLERAREESAVTKSARSSVLTPAGLVTAVPAEYLAGTGSDITVAIDPEGDADGTVHIDLPPVFERSLPGGARTIGTPRIGRGPATLSKSGRRLTVRLTGARAGEPVEIVIPDRGIPAGTHALAVSAGGRDLGDVKVRLYAPSREGTGSSGWDDVRAVNITNDAFTESETFITAVPGNPSRLIAGANGGGGYNAWLSTDGGTTWTRKPMPPALDIPTGDSTLAPQQLCCDPMSAANREGDLWYGGLSFDANDEGFIVVNRIPAGETNFRPTTVALPRRTFAVQDKPMMTIDNSSSSPHFGRLYVTWNEPGANGGINVVASMCDTRPNGGGLDAARCDEADNWSAPADITRSEGSYIYADVAAGPDGTVYLVWWDFSSVNAIRGATCAPTSACTTSAGWSQPKTIAQLDTDAGANPPQVPFACPIMAQPGGRAAPAPMVETDISPASTRGRVYVTWGDLRDSGTTRCQENFDGTGTSPNVSHDTWDSFVASAVNALPGGTSPSASVGTRLHDDQTENGGAPSDDWFPWLAVDQTTGQAYAAFYSTREDDDVVATVDQRRTTEFFVRTVSPNGVGTLEKVSSEPSNYSTNTCCQFGNDYGDYTGVDATCGAAFPIWSSKVASDSDGEAFAQRLQPGAPRPCLTLVGQQVAEVAGLSDGDGTAEPGETLDVTPTVRNGGAAQAEGSSASLAADGSLGLVVNGSAAFPAVAPGSTAAALSAFRVRIDRNAPCGSIAGFNATITGGSYSTTISIPVRANGTNSTCRVAPKAALGASTPTASVDQPVVFDAGGSTDLDGTITRYEWDFDNDGTFDRTTSESSVLHTYTSAGDRTARVRVADDDGETADATTPIGITAPTRNETPTIGLTESGKTRRLDKKGRLALTITTCAGCKGSLTVRSAARVRDGSRRRIVTFGRVRYTANSAGKVTVRVQFSKRNRTLVRRLKRIRLRAAVGATSPQGVAASRAFTLTVKR